MMIKGNFINTAFQFDNSPPEIIQHYVEENELYNQPSLLFLEEKYVNDCNQFSKVMDKFKKKEFNDQLKIYRNNALMPLENHLEEVTLYDKVIAQNNINGINKSDLSISVHHFEIYEVSDKLLFVKSLYVLFFISEITEYKNNDFTFKIIVENVIVKMNLSFSKINIIDLTNVYSWIIDSKENLQTRLRIVREIIARKKSFDLKEADLHSAKSAFNRIIQEETENYFSQLNTLKDDFLKLSEQNQKNYQSLHLKFLGWSSSIALFIYGEVSNDQSNNLTNKLFFSSTEKSNIILVMLIFSLTIIWLLFLKETNTNKKEYEKLKKFYTEHLFFEEESFKEHIEPPIIPMTYKIIFFSLLSIIALRLLVFIL